MRAARFLVLLLPLLAAAAPARAADPDDDRLVTGALAILFQVVHEAAASPDSRGAERAIEKILAGENAQANRMAAGALAEAMEDMTPEQRVLLLAIGRDLAAIARRERARAATDPAAGDAASNPPPAR